MQQLEIEHKNTKKDRREGKGRVLALSRRIYRIQYSDTFYVESERCDNTYYFVKYKPDVIEWCSCMDNSTRGLKCKHIFAVEFAIRMNTLKDTDKLPAEAQRYGSIIATVTTAVPQGPAIVKSYRDDDYDF